MEDFDYTNLIVPGIIFAGAIYFYFFVWKKEAEFNPVPEQPPINDDSKPIEKSKIFF